MPVLFYIASAALGYLLGCPSPAYLLAKLKGFDIRTKGSHNAGASNALITMGWLQAVIVGLFDIGKGFLACFLASVIFGAEYAAVAGLFAIVGHVFPFYLKFNGGKGFATYMGFMLFIDWRAFVAAFILTAAVTLITKYILTATFFLVPAFPIYVFIVKGWYDGIFVTAAAILIIVKHLPNLRRFLKGERTIKLGEKD